MSQPPLFSSPPPSSETAPVGRALDLASPETLVLSCIEQYFWLHSKMPPVDVITTATGLGYQDTVKLLNTAKFKKRLLDKGIINGYQAGRMESYLTFLEIAHMHPGLDPIQIIAANVILNSSDRRSDRKKLEELGITLQQWSAWQHQPDFKAYLTARSASMFGDLDIAANQAMSRMINDDNFQAVKLFFEMTGRYTPKAEVSVQVNVHLVLAAVVEIIAEHVPPELAGVIADAIEVKSRELLRG